MPGAGHSWYDVMQVLSQVQMMMMTGATDFAQLLEMNPAGLESSSVALAELVDAVVEEEKRLDEAFSRGRVILGGFSQGATLSFDVALAHGKAEDPFRALFLWSGLLLRREKLRAMASVNFVRPAGGVFVSHGFQDMTVPYALGKGMSELVQELVDGTAEVYDFEGGHTVPPRAIEAAIQTILL